MVHLVRPLLLVGFLPVGPPLGAQSGPEGAGPCRAPGAERPVSGPVHQGTSSIQVDGRLEEAAWAEAEPLGTFIQVDPDQGCPTRHATEVLLIQGSDGLFVGARLESGGEPRMEGLRRDFDPAGNDLFGVILDGFGDGRFAMVFQTNPGGAQRDFLVQDGRSTDVAWNGVWRVRTRRRPGGWDVEMFLPWETLRYGEVREWGMNLMRLERSTQELSGWSPWQRGLDPWDMTFAGRLRELEAPRAGLNLQLSPYLTGRAVTLGESGPGGAREGDAGLDLKWAATPSTVLDVTVNTDFAEAEVDRQVVNLGRFSVFFPERRAFFLEGAQLFDTGLSVISPFYSRRIGLDAEGLPVPVQVGGRMTSRTPTRSAGALVVRQAAASGSPAATFAVGRFTRNLGATDRVGVLAVHRTDHGVGAVHNTVVATDWFTRPTRTLFFRGMMSHSRTSGTGGDGWAGYFLLGNNAPWGYVGWLQELVTREWEPRTGFAFTRDVVVTSPATNLDLRPGWLPAGVRSYTPGTTIFVFNRPSDGSLIGAEIRARPLGILLENGGSISASILPEWQNLDFPFRPLPEVDVAPGPYRFTRYDVQASLDPSAPLTANATFEWGPFYDGRLNTLTLQGRAAVDPRLVAAASWERNRLEGVGGSSRTTHLVTPEIRISPTPRLELAGIWQYNSAVRASSLNVRLSWEFRPLSFLYVVYNESRPFEEALLTGVGEGRLIVKGVWLWQP